MLLMPWYIVWSSYLSATLVFYLFTMTNWCLTWGGISITCSISLTVEKWLENGNIFFYYKSPFCTHHSNKVIRISSYLITERSISRWNPGLIPRVICGRISTSMHQLIFPWTKWPPFSRRHFQIQFHEWKVLCFHSNFSDEWGINNK